AADGLAGKLTRSHAAVEEDAAARGLAPPEISAADGLAGKLARSHAAVEEDAAARGLAPPEISRPTPGYPSISHEV
ncbi:hypothetical protein T484DRAFT_1772905, partial [Baffinella frigidus]